ncbi:TPA: MFS transporter, partial [Bacillus cereus]
AVSAFGAPLAPTFSILLIMRLIQSVGSSAVYPAGIGLVRMHIQEKQASALAVLSIFSSAMAALGPTVGGFLIVWGGWPSIFLVNFPFIFLSFVLGWYVLPKDSKENKMKLKALIKQMDIMGILLFSVGMILLLWFLLSFKPPPHYVSGIFGVLFLGAFVWRELKVSTPFIDIRLFKSHPTLTWVYLQFILLNLFNYCLFFGLPTYFQEEMHFSIKESGLLMLFMSGISIVFSPISAKWVEKSGTRQPIVFGSFLMLIGAILLTIFFIHVRLIIMCLILMLIGISYGIGNVALQVAMLDASPANIVGTSSGLFQTCRYLGSILSSVVLGLVFGEEITPGHFEILGSVMIAVSIISVLRNMKFSKAY